MSENEARRQLLAEGWRPPLPDGGQDLAEQVAREIRNKLDWHQWPGCDWTNGSLSEIAGVATAAVMPFLDEPPARQVFFPGDTVPAGVHVENNYGDLIKGKSDAWVAQPGAVYVELPRPSSAEWQAAVDRACAERDQSTSEPSSRRRAHACAAVSLSGFPCTHPGDHDGPHRAVFPGGAFTFHDANACRTPGGFPYRQHPHDLCGSNADRQSVGDPGHCEDCCSVGHVVAHPDLGCGDVGCYRTHGDEEANRD